MAEVLGEHVHSHYQRNLGGYRCECGASIWTGLQKGGPLHARAVAAHIADALAAAGFGDVRAAKAEALEAAADWLTVPDDFPRTEQRTAYREISYRLRARAAAVRDEG